MTPGSRFPVPGSRPTLRTVAAPAPATPKALLNEAENCRLIAAQAALFADTRGGALSRAFAREAARARWRLDVIRKRMKEIAYAPEMAA